MKKAFTGLVAFLVVVGCVLLLVILFQGLVLAQDKPLTKDQIVERVNQIDRQLLLFEKQDLIKQFQSLDAKEKEEAKKVESKKDVKK